MSDSGVVNIHGYHVTKSGDVISLHRLMEFSNRKVERKAKILKPSVGKNGYKLVQLGRGKCRYVHRLVADRYLGACPDGFEVRHLDGDRLNNNIENLAYGTRKENMMDAVAHGTMGGRVLSEIDVDEIRCHPKTYGYRIKLADKYGVTPNHITDIRNGRAR